MSYTESYFAILQSMHFCLDEASFHAQVFQYIVSDYFPRLVEVLHLEQIEI